MTCCFVIIITGMSSVSNGQVATPSFDYTLRSNLAAASGWRVGSTFGVGYNQGVLVEDTASSSSKMESNEVSYLVASHIYGPFYIESFKALDTKITTSEDLIGGTELSASLYTIQARRTETTDKTQVNFAFKLGAKNNEYLSLGAQYFIETDEKIVERTWGAKNFEKTDQIGAGLGFSLRLGIIYLAAGTELVNEKETSEKVGNSWNNSMLSLAIMTGEPNKKDTRLRIEVSSITSPESEEPKTSLQTSNIHDSRSNVRTEIEFIPSGLDDWLFSYNNQKITEISSSLGTDKKNDSETYGIVWVPDFGWITGIYYISGEETIFWPSTDSFAATSTISKTVAYRLDVGFNF